MSVNRVLAAVPPELGRRRSSDEDVLRTGERHGNLEFIRVQDGRLVESQVYFEAASRVQLGLSLTPAWTSGHGPWLPLPQLHG